MFIWLKRVSRTFVCTNGHDVCVCAVRCAAHSSHSVIRNSKFHYCWHQISQMMHHLFAEMFLCCRLRVMQTCRMEIDDSGARYSYSVWSVEMQSCALVGSAFLHIRFLFQCHRFQCTLIIITRIIINNCSSMLDWYCTDVDALFVTNRPKFHTFDFDSESYCCCGNCHDFHVNCSNGKYIHVLLLCRCWFPVWLNLDWNMSFHSNLIDCVDTQSDAMAGHLHTLSYYHSNRCRLPSQWTNSSIASNQFEQNK